MKSVKVSGAGNKTFSLKGSVTQQLTANMLAIVYHNNMRLPFYFFFLHQTERFQ